jgi:hypothetical protein
MSWRVGRSGCLEAVVVVVMEILVVVDGFCLVSWPEELALGTVRVVWAVLMRRCKSEMSGSSGLGQRELLLMVLRAQS